MYDACVPWPERPKGAKDKSRGPKGLELEVGAPKLLVFHFSSVHVRTTKKGEKLNKYNHCDFSSSRAANLRTYLKTHGGKNPNKCKQCNVIRRFEDIF